MEEVAGGPSTKSSHPGTSPDAGRPGDRHPSQLSPDGQQETVNKMTRAPQQTFRKLLRKGEVGDHLMAKPGHLALGVAAGWPPCPRTTPPEWRLPPPIAAQLA